MEHYVEEENDTNWRVLQQNERRSEITQMEGSIVYPTLIDGEHAETRVRWKWHTHSEL